MTSTGHDDRLGTPSGAAAATGTATDRGGTADAALVRVGASSRRVRRGVAGASLAVAAALLLTPAVPAASAGQGEWGPWESLAGDVRSLPDCRMQGRTIDCWALSAGGTPTAPSTLAWLRGDGETWNPWVNLGGALRAAPECVSRGDRIDCFAATAVAQGSRLGWISYDGTAWSGWEQLGGSVKQKPACIAGPGREITCVALATSDTGLYSYFFDGESWQTAELIPFGAGIRSTLRPSCTDTARGLQCFIVDTSQTLRTILRDKDGAWGEWEPLAGSIGEPPHCLASGTKLDCFSKSRTGPSTAGQLISASFNGKRWSDWLPVGDATVQSQPYCNKLGSGFDCYWTTNPATGTLVRRQRDHGVWLPEEDLGRPAGTTVVARPECLATPGGQRIDCFVQGTDNKLWHRAFD